jgi:tetratricopeptide (TPR) repeat protein
MEVRLPALANARDRCDLLTNTQNQLERALALCPSHAQTWSDLSYVLSQWSRERPKESAEFGRRAEAAALRALALSTKAPEFWMRLGIAQDMQRRWTEADKSFSRAATLAPSSLNLHFYLAFHYSLNAATLDKAREQVDICLRLDPSLAPAQALKLQLARITPSR